MPSTIQATAADFQATVTQYLAAICTMTKYAAAIINSQLPSLSDFQIIDATDYDNYTTQYGNMTSSASLWYTGVQPSLNNVVVSISNASALITEELGFAISAAQTLQSNPTDPNALSTLNKNLVSLSSNLGTLAGFLKSTSDLVTNNQSIIINNSADLASIKEDIANMLTAANNDLSSIQNSINNMNNTIAALNSQIDFDEVLKWGGVLEALIGFVVTFAGNPIGGGVMFFEGIVGADIAGQEIGLDEQTVATLQIQVNNLQSELNSDTAAYAAAQTAQGTVTSFSTLIGTILQNGSPLQQIESFIGTALTDVEQLQASVTKAQEDEGNWPQVITDLQTAQSEWTTIQQLVGNSNNFTISFAQNVVIQPSV